MLTITKTVLVLHYHYLEHGVIKLRPMMCFVDDSKPCVSLMISKIWGKSLLCLEQNISSFFMHRLPSIVSNANGKPVLINKSRCFTRHSNHIEMSINVLNFSHIAKKCLHMLFPKFVSMVLNVGFTIEGRDDHELPELLLGGAKVFNMDPDSIPATIQLQLLNNCLNKH